MQRRRLATAVVWMVCLLGMVAVVWSRPPLGGPRTSEHPPLPLPARDMPNPMPEEPAPQAPIQENVAAAEAQPGPSACPALPSGEWVRDIPPYKISLKFEGNRLLATLGGTVDEKMEVEWRFAGDYHLTKDSMLYGIVTSAEILIAPDHPEKQLEADQTIQQFFDQPFALRYRFDGETLTVKDFKLGHLTVGSADDLKKHAVGCYHRTPEPGPSPE